MIIAITGGTGFIGSHLVQKHLNAKDEVRVLVRGSNSGFSWDPRVRCYGGGLVGNTKVLQQFAEGADVLYHCAGEISQAADMLSTNVEGTRTLLDAAAGKSRRWVQLSSVGVYGPVRQGRIGESAVLAPQGRYAESKAAADLLVLEAAAKYDFEFSILRPSTVIGADMRNRSIFQMISAIARGLFFFVGQKGASANYVPVDNVIDALYRCGTSPAAVGKTFNISEWQTIESFAGSISDALGLSPINRRIPELPLRWASRGLPWLPKMPLTTARIDAMTTRVVYSSDAIGEQLGYVPVQSVEGALRDIVAVWRGGSQNNLTADATEANSAARAA